VAKLTIIPGSQAVAIPGETAQFIAIGTSGITGLQSDLTDTAAWSSSSPSVATISFNGVAKGVGQGTSTITAIATNPDGTVVTATATFTVTSGGGSGSTAEPVSALTIIPNSQSVPAPGGTGQFVAIATSGVTGLQTNATTKVTWSSSNVGIATINASGLATGVSQGTTAILAIATNPDGSVVTAIGTFTVAGKSGTTSEPISSLSIIPGAQSVAAPGETGQFIAIGTSGTTGLQSNLTGLVTWSSSSVNVATITPAGLATGVSQGTTAITAIATNPDGSVVTGTATFTVTGTATAAPEPISSVSIIPSALSVSGAGQTGQFIAIGTSGLTGLQSNITNQVAWSSSTVGVATIGAATGLATGVSEGTTVITAIATNPDKSVVTGTATFTVLGPTAEPVSELAIVPTSESVALPGETGQFYALGLSGSTGLITDVTNQVAWHTSNAAVAAVSSSGLATAIAQGTTTITAIATNPDESVATATASFTVTNVASEPYKSLTIIPSSQSVASPEQTSQFLAIGTTSAGATQNLTGQVAWSSSAAGIATIGANTGLATAVSEGTTAIIATMTLPDGSVVTGTATLTVIGGIAEPITALTISPTSQALSATGQLGQFIALGTSGTTGLINDVTNSPQLAWTSSIPTIATVSTYPASPAGQAKGASPGNTTITAQWTNPDSSVVTATATVAVSLTAAPEPLLAITLIPSSQTVPSPNETAQFIAMGTFSTPPTQQMLPTSDYPLTWSSSSATIATITDSGIATSVSPGTTAIIATSTNADGTVVTGVGTYTENSLNIFGAAGGTPPLSTLTVYNGGSNDTNWLVTAPSSSGAPNLIHCGPGSVAAGLGNSVCVANYPVGFTVTLTESPTGSSFGGWSSNCENPLGTPDVTPTCTLILPTDAAVGAIFN
jgi:hypothetical protein